MPRGEQTSNKTYFKVAYENNNKDKGNPFFAEQKKIGNEWTGVSHDTFLEGKVIGISKNSYEYKNETQYTFELLINGGDENYALQLNYGYFPRNILNSIASIKDLANTSIRLEIYRNKDGYVNVAVKNTTNKHEGERTDWLLEVNKLPKLKDEKWEDSFNYLIDIIKDNLLKSTAESPEMGAQNDNPIEEPQVESSKPKQKPLEEMEDDDLPF